MTNYKRHTELEVWIEATSLVSEIYKVTLAYPNSELFGIVSQLRRCAVSIPSNIAEGCGRQHSKELIQFLAIARASLYELETQLYISKELEFITANQLNLFLHKIESQGKLINGFITYYKTKIYVEYGSLSSKNQQPTTSEKPTVSSCTYQKYQL